MNENNIFNDNEYGDLQNEFGFESKRLISTTISPRMAYTMNRTMGRKKDDSKLGPALKHAFAAVLASLKEIAHDPTSKIPQTWTLPIECGMLSIDELFYQIGSYSSDLTEEVCQSHQDSWPKYNTE